MSYNYIDPVYTQTGDINCFIFHPVLGKLAYTASASDPELIGRILFTAIVAAGGIAPYEEPVALKPVNTSAPKTVS